MNKNNNKMDLLGNAPVPQALMALGIPIMIGMLINALYNLVDAYFIGGLGESQMGAISIAFPLGQVVVGLGLMFGNGAASYLSRLLGRGDGAKKFDRLREAIKTSILWSTIFCVVVGLTIALFSTQIISQFTEGNTEMISVGQKSLMANGFSFFVFGFYTVYSSLFLALGKGTAGFVLGACRQGICFVPIILLLPSFWGINGILYAQPIADVISAIVTVFMALHLHKELATTKEH